MGFIKGNLVKIIRNTSSHSFKNEVGLIIKVKHDFPLPYLVDFPKGAGAGGHDGEYGGEPGVAKNGWWFYEEELTIAEEQVVDKILIKYGNR